MTAVVGQTQQTTGEPRQESPGDTASSGWRARLGVACLIGTAPAATLYLSFSNGGFFPNSVGLVAICFCAAFVLRVTLADRPFEGGSRIAGLAVVAFALFALLQLISITWSHTPTPALDDFDRTFLYVLVLALFASLPRTGLRLVWLTRSLTAAMTFVCLAGLISRVLPHLWPVAQGFFADRLNYPLGYWNALGLMGAIACILLLHFASSLREPRPVRVLAAALFPAVATTALLTYSRGALAVAVIGLVVYALLGRPRGLLSALVALAPSTFLALRSGYDAVLLSGNHPTSPAAVAQGHHVALTVGLGMVLAGVLRSVGLLLDRWLARPHRTPPALARVPRWGWLSAIAAVLVAALVIAGASGFISRQYRRFVVTHGPNVAQVRDRLTDPASNGRLVVWRLALEQFSSHSPFGEGAGTYQRYWAQHRTINDTVTDAHSLYLQTLGEDGIPGVVLLAVVVLSVGVTLCVRVRSPHRSLYAALFAAALAWAVHNQVDWDWQMPAVTLWVFAVGGLALSTRRRRTPTEPSNLNRTGLAACFLALAVAPLLIGFSYQRLRASSAALVNGNCAQARQKAISSLSLLAVRPEAYEILGYCDVQQSYPTEALSAMRKAVAYDPNDWQSHYGLAIALAADGRNPVPEARQALRLNPREAIVQDEVTSFEASAHQAWPETAQIVMSEGLNSGPLSVVHL